MEDFLANTSSGHIATLVSRAGANADGVHSVAHALAVANSPQITGARA